MNPWTSAGLAGRGKGGRDTSKGKEVETTSPKHWVQVEGRCGRGGM